MNKKVGKISQKVIDILKLDYDKELDIFIGQGNIDHMKKRHLGDFEKYGNDIEKILGEPKYLAKNDKKGYIEFVREYKENDDLVLVGVRVSNKGVPFARTMYVMDDIKVEKYFKNDYFYFFDT